MRIIKYDIKELSTICSMRDFYDKLGLLPDFESQRIQNVSKQICMENDNCDTLLDYTIKNWRKNKTLKSFDKTKAKQALIIDWASFSPKSLLGVPEDEIWIYDIDDNGNIS